LNGKYSQLTKFKGIFPGFLFITAFQISRFSIGDVVSEELSKYFPSLGSFGLLSNIDPVTGFTPTGSLTNLYPIGFLVGLIPVDGIHLFAPLLVDLILSYMLVFSTYLFLHFLKLSSVALVSAHLSIVTSFVFLNTTQYQSKTYGAVLALLGFTLFRSKLTGRKFYTAIALLAVSTYGVISNPAVLITSLLFIIISFSLISRNEEPRRTLHRKVVGLGLLFILYVPGILNYWFSSNSLGLYRSNLEGVKLIFGSNLRVFAGGGYWAENEIVNDRNFYFPWRSQFFQISEILEMCFNLFFIVFILILPYKMFNRKLNTINARLSFLLQVFLLLILFYLILAPVKSNIINHLINVSGVFYIWREPWSKFAFIAYCLWITCLWMRCDRISRVLKQDLNEIEIGLQRVKSRRTLTGKRYIRRVRLMNRTQTQVLKLLPFGAIFISILSILAISDAFLKNQSRELNGFANWKSTFQQVQYVNNDKSFALLTSKRKVYMCIKARSPQDYYYPTQQLLEFGTSKSSNLSGDRTPLGKVQFGRCENSGGSLGFEYISSGGTKQQLLLDRSKIHHTYGGFIFAFQDDF
jgi:hypothetical protein